MFTSSLQQSQLWTPFVTNPVLLQSLQWIEANASTVSNGIHELGKAGWYVNVHGYTTQGRADCNWENHPATIDIQYLIEGEEAIDFLAVRALGEPTSFKPETDTEMFADPEKPCTTVVLNSGNFVILLPGEAHRPKISVRAPTGLKKLVVKIPLRIIGS